MRVVTNENTIHRNRQISQYSFFAGIGIIIASLFFGGRIAETSEDATFFVNCVLPFFLLGLILFAVRMSNQWIREPVPWKALQDALQGYSSDATLYHYIFPARHVLIAPSGVYVLMTYFHDRPIRVTDDRWYMPGGITQSIFTFMRQERIGNPTLEAKLEAELLQRFLDKHLEGHGVEVHPVIVFIHPRAQLLLRGEQSIPVVYAKATKKKDKPKRTDNDQPDSDEVDDNDESDESETEQTVNPRMSLREYLQQQKKAGRATLKPEQISVLEDLLIYE